MPFRIEKNKVVFFGMEEIGFMEGCDIPWSVREVVLPNGLKAILKDAFYDNPFLEKINIPETVQEIHSMAFWGLDSLEEIVLSPSIQIIEKYAFCNCTNLTVTVLCKKEDLPKGWHKECFANVKEIRFREVK
ncbi:MAG: leucine-rich repeat domain-containing protein [Clostridia bacterium]|nr:leucine-rich repeat domain-containing protein [Clostridia bacterium]